MNWRFSLLTAPNSQSDLDSIQAEITQRLNEIDPCIRPDSVQRRESPGAGQHLTIQVGANDGETIDIDLKQINSQTLGLDSLNVQKAYDVSATDVISSTYSDGTQALTAPTAN
ncbi:flagellin [Salmonella enterica subsp. enterica]|nr:flagellin [Salmonella enterica subsp. enterica]